MKYISIDDIENIFKDSCHTDAEALKVLDFLSYLDEMAKTELTNNCTETKSGEKSMKQIPIEVFIETIQQIQSARQRDESLYEVFQNINPDTYLMSVCGYLEQPLVELLKFAFDDTNNLIEYWIYDMEFGIMFERGDYIVDEKEVKLTTITELYAALCEEYIYYE